MFVLQSMPWRNRPLCPALTWWWTVQQTPRIPMQQGSSAANCLHSENSSNPGSGGRRRPVTSFRTFPKVGLVLIRLDEICVFLAFNIFKTFLGIWGMTIFVFQFWRGKSLPDKQGKNSFGKEFSSWIKVLFFLLSLC